MMYLKAVSGAQQTKGTDRRGRNGDANKLIAADRPAHDWYRFVLSFPPHLVRKYLERFRLNKSQCVLDPFCGTGTTLVECKKRGIPSVGVEASPMAYHATRVKVDWGVDPYALRDHAQKIAATALATLEADRIEDNPAFSPRNINVGTLRQLDKVKYKLILGNSISPLPLHKTLVLLDALKTHSDPRYEWYERLALARALVFHVSNLRFGPEVGVGPAKPDAPVVAAWLTAVQTMVNDIHILRGLNDMPAIAYRADARFIADVIAPESVDAVITSPPYPNEKDYTRTTRLESVLLGLINNKEELQALKRTLVRSNTRGVYQSDEDDQIVANHPEIQRIAEEIEARRIALGKTSGFERLYARVTKLYFGGMARHLADLREVLRPGAQLAYVVGDQASYLRVMIRTGQLLADISQSMGYEVVGIDLFRTRLATATKEQLREEVVLLRWPGK